MGVDECVLDGDQEESVSYVSVGEARSDAQPPEGSWMG